MWNRLQDPPASIRHPHGLRRPKTLPLRFLPDGWALPILQHSWSKKESPEDLEALWRGRALPPGALATALDCFIRWQCPSSPPDLAPRFLFPCSHNSTASGEIRRASNGLAMNPASHPVLHIVLFHQPPFLLNGPGEACPGGSSLRSDLQFPAGLEKHPNKSVMWSDGSRGTSPS